MRVVVVTPPDPVVTWQQAQAHLRLDGDGEQQEVEAMIAAITGHLDGPDGWLGRSLGVQTLEARFDLVWSGAPLRLPYGPVLDLVSAKYLAAAGGLIDAGLTDLELVGDEVLPVGTAYPWEGGSLRREAGRVQYRAGYAELPAPIRAAILLMVGDLHRFRTTASDMNVTPTAIPMSASVHSLLQPFRIYR